MAALQLAARCWSAEEMPLVAARKPSACRATPVSISAVDCTSMQLEDETAALLSMSCGLRALRAPTQNLVKLLNSCLIPDLLGTQSVRWTLSPALSVPSGLGSAAPAVQASPVHLDSRRTFQQRSCPTLTERNGATLPPPRPPDHRFGCSACLQVPLSASLIPAESSWASSSCQSVEPEV